MNKNDFLKIYVTDVSQLMTDDEMFSTAMNFVPEERRKKALRFRFRKDQSLSLGAGLLLRFACIEHGLPKLDETVICTASGKPYFPESPEFFFSLAHSGSFAVCAVSSCPVGCDVEQLKEIKRSLAERFFHKKEIELLRHEILRPSGDPFPDGDDNERNLFYALWTLKESFLKCTGDGLSRPLDSFAVAPEGQKNSSGWISAVLTYPEKETSRYSFLQREVQDYSLALCIHSSLCPGVKQQMINLSAFLA